MKTDRSRESLTRGQQVIACLALFLFDAVASARFPLGPSPRAPHRQFAIVGGERCKILHLDAPPLRSAIFLYKFPYSCAPPQAGPSSRRSELSSRSPSRKPGDNNEVDASFSATHHRGLASTSSLVVCTK